MVRHTIVLTNALLNAYSGGLSQYCENLAAGFAHNNKRLRSNIHWLWSASGCGQWAIETHTELR